MKNKTEELYSKVFNILRNLVLFNSPNEIIIDCEKAAKNAFEKIFTCSIIIHCLTHFSASVHRRLLKYNLNYDYNTCKKFKSLVKMLKSSIFIPTANFSDAINLLLKEFSIFDDFRISGFVKSVLEIFAFNEKDNYLLKNEYSNHNRILNNRPLTTNIAEAYNNAFSKDLNYTKVSLLNFVECLKKGKLSLRKK